MKLAIVKWIDAWSCSKWQDAPAKGELASVECVSIGWVVVHDKEQILLAGTVTGEVDDRQINQAMAIPVGFIKSIKYVGTKYTIR